MGLTHIVDRRLNGKNKSAVNRERFLRRYRQHIKKAVSDAVGKRSITDMDRGESISIPSKDIEEPIFRSGKGGVKEMVHPGNKEFNTGDQLPRPPGGQGGGGSGQGEASDSGEGVDDFVFQISQDEFLDFMFEDLELPNLIKKQLKDTTSYKYLRAGYSNEGTPSKINIVRSLRGAYARRLAMTGKTRETIRELEAELQSLRDDPHEHHKRQQELEDEIARLKERIQRIPWIDEFDLKFNQFIKQPVPCTSAVMFCLMDVSGSMSQMHKDIAKRFYILLYLFLKRNYQKIDVVFIRHHTSAKEVDEEEFFYSRETGGTIVSSAIKLMQEIMQKRYSSDEWNIYAAQASDGDNWNDDSPLCTKILRESILPYVQYYSYIEITPHEHQMLWHEFEKLSAEFQDNFAMQHITDASEIYPVFRKLFQRKPA
ncbi:MAG: YeaH/YhbH family protein [Oleiphilaceae bacterium]|nr:YeaH/YhbH family protein [Oleiphilaceae bacterium]